MVDVSVIGCGNLGSAVIRGLARAGGHTVTACDVSESALADVEADADRTTTDLGVAAEADVIVLAVEPGTVETVLADLELSEEQTLLSFAAAVPREFVAARTDARVVRGMPNLAAETTTMACAITGEATPAVETLLDDLGEYVVIEESQMDTATALNGSGPAFVFAFITALRDAGVEGGLDADDARLLAAQTVTGAAQTVLDSEESLEQLVDSVATPGGTTIEGLEVLWDSDANDVFADAVHAAARRSVELSEGFDDGD